MLCTSSKDSMHEVRIRHQLPMKDADVVVLFAPNHYSAAVKWKIKADEVKVDKVQGLDYAPDLKGDDTSDEDDDEDSVSIPFQKAWSTCYETKPRPEQRLVCIPEMYKFLVAPFRERIGTPLTDTTGLACPFCPQEFRSSNILRYHYKMHQKTL